MTKTTRIAVTGAAGQIGYAMLFRIASGEMLGAQHGIDLRLLEIPPAMDALRGVVMELEDCAFPLLENVVPTTDPNEAFADVDIALLVGARPRGAGMERKDLLAANGAIFTTQGKALSDNASRDVRVLVVGNPANTNCLIAVNNAKTLASNQFTAMTILDHHRAVAQLAQKTRAHVQDVRNLAIWGNHSSTMFPELHSATVKGIDALDLVTQDWYNDEFIPCVQQRGAQIIQAKGTSSAASAANAAIDHMRYWSTESPGTTSMSIVSQGEYGIESGLVFSYPVVCHDGQIDVIQNRVLDDFAQQRIKLTEQELIEERDAIRHLL